MAPRILSSPSTIPSDGDHAVHGDEQSGSQAWYS
jgi:hypothetical protein